MTKNEQSVTGTHSPQQVAADLFRIGENPNLPAWQYPVLQRAIGLLASPVEQSAAAQVEEMIRFCPECGRLADIPVGYEACCPDWSEARMVPKRFAELCAETFRLCVSRPGLNSASSPADKRAAFSSDDLDFAPDAQHTVADMANIGYALLEQIVRMVPGYSWNDSPVEIVSDLINERDEARASTTNEPEAEGFTYATKQATACASCGEHKHTPLRVDRMGGYVCLTCIDHELDRSVALADDQRAAVEFALGACAGHVSGERHVPALESLLSATQEAR
ncbi:hypothetical protein [Burkholderia cenocepacia]|uniref:Hypothetical phage protein n=1 Tax=Burkholderia cenocepacia (strain ATCC BAA-245 / DSM 16553 / LMG 16656 / NCTC 13227 / J2315 / CF5610) TaxID=216591 RepID=B4E880_BURCJ|nr:hypothetical protein [Burkholderia cenocepacia]YP_002221440.1 hypothetical protein KS10_gp24 [Burkholderia phage KS10]KIS46134.1 hypothetical protein NP88_5601 [Burkholderia cepacia]ACH72943.1 gp24 [Burkholderia phage KS10]EPZ87042.1 hypothetical protein BURCENK562V_C1656 [Burkholderia cenocepacia K56-2Valvano]ERI25622.1 hypothetical protein BURCENBC7_AP6668 [Burkholderia cenocepacia BC7]KKI79211.1 hypothetical protein WQ49_31840 [Burkholderia cenocepacia]